MKKICYTLLLASINMFAFAQAVLPTSWNFATTTLPTGWTSTGGGFGYYPGSGNPSPAAKFSYQSDKLTINFNSTPGLLEYDLVGNPPPSTTWAGTFTVQESANGSTWTTVGTAYTQLAPTYTHFSNTLLASTRYVRFDFTTKTNGNVGLDNVSIAVGVSTVQEINVKQGSATVVNGSTYTTSSPVSTPTTITFTVQNTGTVDTLHVSAIALSGAAAADYAITTPTVFSVAPSSDSVLNVDFTPSVAGTRNAVLTITSDDANGNGSYVINLNGIGGNLSTEPTAQPTSLTFPIVKSYKISASFTASSPAADGYLVLRKTGAAITDVPVDGTVYQRGDMIGSAKVVYSSNATGFVPNDIQANTHYYFAVYAYNGTGTYRNYLTTSPLTGDIMSSGSMAPSNYYNAISTTSPTFVTDLHALVNPHTAQLYSNYGPYMVAPFYTRDTTNNQRVVTCGYSGADKIYSEPFDWTTYNFSREHTYCSSWMPTVNASNYESKPEYNDYHMIRPVDQNNVNAIRSNYPLGVVVTPTYTYLGCKLGNDANGKKVFEPADRFKGDAARAMLYQCITYTGVPYTGTPNTDATYGGSWSLPNHISNTIPHGQQQDVLKLWNTQDPPDNFEIARNDYVDSLQGNRNPFIDHPEYICFIDFSNMLYVGSGNCDSTATPAGIAEFTKGNEIIVSPNPNNGTFIINYTSEKSEKVSVTLMDMLGHKVYSNELKSTIGNNTLEINTNNLNSGIYMLQWLTDSNRKTEKLIIE